MSSYANVSTDYSIGRPITGDMVLSDLALTGWGAVTANVPSLFTWTNRGRLWAVFTASTGDLSLYRHPAAASGDKVCGGTVTSGAVTLSAANTSGITGTAKVTNGTAGTNPEQDSTGTVVISYAHELDLADAYGIGLDNELDGSSKYRGRDTRFEAVLKTAKRDIDAKLREYLAPNLPSSTSRLPDLSAISDPRQDNLVRAHAMIGAAIICELRGPLDPAFYNMGKDLRRRAYEVLQSRKVMLDSDADSVIDAKPSISSAEVVLG